MKLSRKIRYLAQKLRELDTEELYLVAEMGGSKNPLGWQRDFNDRINASCENLRNLASAIDKLPRAHRLSIDPKDISAELDAFVLAKAAAFERAFDEAIEEDAARALASTEAKAAEAAEVATEATEAEEVATEAVAAEEEPVAAEEVL